MEILKYFIYLRLYYHPGKQIDPVGHLKSHGASTNRSEYYDINLKDRKSELISLT